MNYELWIIIIMNYEIMNININVNIIILHQWP